MSVAYMVVDMYDVVELVNVEAVVQCIRSTSSPQIQQQALIVMTAIAPLYPVCISCLRSVSPDSA